MRFAVIAVFAVTLFFSGAPMVLAVTQAECAAQGLVRHPPSDTCRPSNECPITVCGIPANPAENDFGANTVGTRTQEEAEGDQAAAAARDQAARDRAAAEAAAFRAAQTGQTSAEVCAEERDNNIPLDYNLCKLTHAIENFAFNISMGVVWWILATVARLFFWGAQFLLWLSTSLVDMVVYFLVLNMGFFVNNTGADSIRVAWTILRDLANIAIIAGFVIVGFSTILQVAQYSANKFLARLIIAALLVNFSYFIAGAIIDASNFIASEIYTSNVMQTACGGKTITLPSNLRYRSEAGVGTARLFSDKGPNGLCSFSESLTASLGLGSWANVEDLAGRTPGEQRSTNQWWDDQTNIDLNKKLAVIGLMGGLFMVVTGYVLFAASILLLGRFVVLILLLVTSPIGVAGTNIPYLDQYASRWWSALIGQALFAPVYFLLVAISLIIIKNLIAILGNPEATQQSFASIATGRFADAVNVIPMMITFMLAIAFMYASLQIAKQMSESGKEFFGQIYAALDRNLGGIYGNLYVATARRALGIPGQIYDATLGQAARIPYVGGLLGLVTNPIGKSLRLSQDSKPFGATKSAAEQAKETQDYVKSLETVPNIAGLTQGIMGIPHGLQRLGESMSRWFRGKTVEQILDRVTELSKKQKSGVELSEDEKAELAEGEKLLRAEASRFSDDDIKGMTGKELEQWAPFLTSAQISLARSRDDLSDRQKKAIVDSRFSKLDAAIARGDFDEVRRLLQDMDETDHKLFMAERQELRADEKLHSKILSLMTKERFDQVTKDRTIYSAEEAEEAGKARKAGFEDILTNGSDDEVRAAFKRMSDDEIANIDTISKRVLDLMTPAQVRKLHEGADQKKRDEIRRILPETRHGIEVLDVTRRDYRSEPPSGGPLASQPPGGAPPAPAPAPAPAPKAPPQARPDSNPPPNPPDNRDAGIPPGTFRRKPPADGGRPNDIVN